MFALVWSLQRVAELQNNINLHLINTKVLAQVSVSTFEKLVFVASTLLFEYFSRRKFGLERNLLGCVYFDGFNKLKTNAGRSVG